MARTIWRLPVKPPIGAAEIDWGHRLAPRRICALFHEGVGLPVELVTRRVITKGGSPGWTTNVGGLAVTSPTTSDYWIVETPNLPTAEITVAVLRRKTDTTLRASALFGLPTAGDNLNAHVPYSDGTVYWDFGLSGAPNRLTWGGYSVSTGLEFWVFTAGAFGSAIYLNGIQRASQGTGISRSSAAGNFWINSYQVAQADLQDISLFLMDTRAWTEADVRQWQVEPYGFLRPLIRRRYFVSSGTGSGTLNATLAALTSSATGALAISGAATPTLEALTSSATGALPIAGVAAITFEDLTPTATGALAVAGVAPITLAELALGATGALALTGAVDATLGALTLTAYENAPTIQAAAFDAAPFRYVRGRGRPH